MKGREWYQESDIARTYEDKRFSRGGRLIDRREKTAVLDALGPVEDRRILEIACGTGRFTVLLADQGADITGLDISGPMLKQAHEKADAAGIEVEFMRGDAARLPFPDDHFDAVFAMRFFHLANEPATFLREMARVTTEQVVFDTFNRFSSRSIYNFLLPMGSRLYSRREVRALVEGVGMEIADAEHDFFFPYGLYRKLPGWMASPVRDLDETLIRDGPFDGLASVSYWNVTP